MTIFAGVDFDEGMIMLVVIFNVLEMAKTVEEKLLEIYAEGETIDPNDYIIPAEVLEESRERLKKVISETPRCDNSTNFA